MSKDTKIIGFRGKKGVGKNFVASLTKEVLNQASIDVSEGAFAACLKNFCTDALGLSHSQCHGTDTEKNSFTRYSWSSMPGFVLEKYPEKSGNMTAREIMQVFGTEFIRESFGRDVWTNALYRSILASDSQYYLVTDVRFENECEIIHEWEGEIWQIEGPQRGEEAAKYDKHPSETDLEKEVRIDRIIDNGFGQDVKGLRFQIEQALGLVAK